MVKFTTTASIFIIFSLCLLSQAANMTRFAFNKGKIRALETTDALTTLPFKNHTNNTAVTVKFSEDYIQRANLTADAQTDMLISLFTNLTGFCSDCPEFVHFACEESYCNATLDENQNLLSHNYVVTKGIYINQSVSFGSWNLTTPAFYYRVGVRSINAVEQTSSSRKYIGDNTTYGIIGLGISGDAYKNFNGHPLFSLQVNTSGQGQFIFGKDNSLYDSTRTPAKISTNGNWTTKTFNFTWGPNVTLEKYSSKLTFDLQFPGIALPFRYYSYIMDNIVPVYNITNDGDLSGDYNYVYKGKLSKLPNLEIGFYGEGEKLVLPPSAYTRKIAENTYLILVSEMFQVYDTVEGENIDFTVLGWPVLSQFYTVFEAQDENTPVVTLYPTYTPLKDDDNILPSLNSLPMGVKVALVALVVVIFAFAVAKCKSKRAASKLQDELGNFYGDSRDSNTNYTRATNNAGASL